MKKKAIKQSTLTIVTAGISLAVCIILIIAALFTRSAFQEVQLAESRKAEFRQLGFDIVNASNYLTDEARRYLLTGDKEHVNNYWREVNETKSMARALQRLIELNAPREEISLVGKGYTKFRCFS